MIINATPHTIHILYRNGICQNPKTLGFEAKPEDVRVATEIAPSGSVARVAMQNKPATSIEGIPIEEVIYGEIEGLPPEQPGIFYIVSGLVAAAAAKQGRRDCFGPGGLVRDVNNPSNVLGALFLQKP